MGKFRDLFNHYRATAKAGVRSGVNLPKADENSNISPLADTLGNAWVRDASNPGFFFDSSNPNSSDNGWPTQQRFSMGLATDFLLIGQAGLNLGVPAAIYKVSAMFGDPATPWVASPYYLQIHTPYNLATFPNAGAIPAYSFPCPRPNEGQGRFEVDFGVATPFNCVSGGGGGACICISVTPYVYTNPGGFLGNISAVWAYYDYVV